LPYINGMYSACVPTLIYALFGQSRQLAVGPVAMVSLLVEAGLNGQLGPECTVEDKPQYEAGIKMDGARGGGWDRCDRWAISEFLEMCNVVDW
jgi:hypothetical protein